MYRRDYIKRAIEDLAKVLGYIMGLKKDGRTEEARQAVSEAYTEFFKLSPDELAGIPVQDLVSTLKDKHSFGPGQMGMLADLLNADATLMDEQGREQEALERYRFALCLYLEENREQANVFSVDRNAKISYIEDRLKKG